MKTGVKEFKITMAVLLLMTAIIVIGCLILRIGAFIEQIQKGGDDCSRKLNSIAGNRSAQFVTNTNKVKSVTSKITLDYKKKSFEELYVASLGGVAEAQYYLGEYYYKKEKFKLQAQMPTNAIKWFREAAKQKYTPALIKLASCYESGIGVKKDEAKALELYLEAATLGDSLAQFYLSGIYKTGRCGVRINEAKATEWYRKSGFDKVIKSALANGKKHKH